MTMAQRKPYYLTDFADPRTLKEKQVEAMVKSLYETAGCWVVKFSQPHKASQTPGIPDLRVHWPAYTVQGPGLRTALTTVWDSDTAADVGEQVWWHEVKRYRAKPTPVQREFHERLAVYGETTEVGGLNTAIAALRARGIAHFEERDGHW